MPKDNVASDLVVVYLWERDKVIDKEAGREVVQHGKQYTAICGNGAGDSGSS